MNINLSEEMICKITNCAFGRIHDLKQKRAIIEEGIAVGNSQIKRKQMQLREIDNAIEDAKEIHSLFLELGDEL